MKRISAWASLLALALLTSACTAGPAPVDAATVVFRYSKFEPSLVRVPAGAQVTVTLVNDDPIGHEWIVGPADLHATHRVGTEPYHEGRPNEVSLPPYSTRATTLTFDQPGSYAFICHLPGHEAYGMVGTLQVV